MLISIHPEDPELRKTKRVVQCLKDGGVIIYPTDTVYALGCDVYNKSALEKLCVIKNLNVKRHNLSFICYDLSHISEFTRNLSRKTYKLMKKHLPGPYTFILNANNTIPKLFKNKKKEVGIRIPNNNIAREIVKELGNPIASTSIKNKDIILEYISDPYIIHEYLNKRVDLIIDGGMGGLIPSTVVNCTTENPEIIRKGKGDVNLFS